MLTRCQNDSDSFSRIGGFVSPLPKGGKSIRNSSNMRQCPTCSQIFNDAGDFCVDDGTRLLSKLSGLVSQSTQLISPLAHQVRQPKTNTFAYFPFAICVLAAVILGLVGFLFFSTGTKEPVNVRSKNALSRSNVTSTPEDNRAARNGPTLPLTVSIDAARQLISRWEKAQDERNFPAYRSCYASTFFGIKRTPDGSRKQLNYGAWMGDRGRMLRNMIELRVEYPSYSIDGDAAIAEFRQHFRSVNHCDVGEKTIRIKMFADGPKIVFEELKNPVGCD